MRLAGKFWNKDVLDISPLPGRKFWFHMSTLKILRVCDSQNMPRISKNHKTCPKKLEMFMSNLPNYLDVQVTVCSLCGPLLAMDSLFCVPLVAPHQWFDSPAAGREAASDAYHHPPPTPNNRNSSAWRWEACGFTAKHSKNVKGAKTGNYEKYWKMEHNKKKCDRTISHKDTKAQDSLKKIETPSKNCEKMTSFTQRHRNGL